MILLNYFQFFVIFLQKKLIVFYTRSMENTW